MFTVWLRFFSPFIFVSSSLSIWQICAIFIYLRVVGIHCCDSAKRFWERRKWAIHHLRSSRIFLFADCFVWVSNVKSIFIAVVHRHGQNHNSKWNQWICRRVAIQSGCNGFSICENISTIPMSGKRAKNDWRTKLKSVITITKYAVNCVWLRPLHMDGNRGMSCLRVSLPHQNALYIFIETKSVWRASISSCIETPESADGQRTAAAINP